MTNRTHIGIFGRRNVGKSSVINLLAGQDVAIVSETPGTTTDPVRKHIELFGIGAVTLIDTAGTDDDGTLGQLRIEKTRQVIAQIDVAILVIAGNSIGTFEEALMNDFREFSIPFLVLHNKADLQPLQPATEKRIEDYRATVLDFTALPAPPPVGENALDKVVQVLLSVAPQSVYRQKSLLDGLVERNDVVLLITPIDSEAPEGRMILPQVQTIRAALYNNCVAVTLKETEVETFLQHTGIRPKLAITDSQLFGKIDKLIPPEIPLTGFSILLARSKGNFDSYRKGTPAISRLQNGDRILVLESCTHQTTCDDIGRVKIPNLLRQFTGKSLMFDVVSGLSALPCNISGYALAIQCGACMITANQLRNRLRPVIAAGVPATNYGMAIAYMNGIYERAMEMFEE
jgi:[FeFe] hydrogenase H-cluster maturation GTPase HydF